MKTYTKTHTSRKAADAHLAKIKARGGIGVLKVDGRKYIIDYYFLPKAGKTIAAKEGKKRYDILDPNGKSIRLPGVPLFETLKASNDYFDQWQLKHMRQGFWSPSKGLIIGRNLKRYCKWITLTVDKNSLPVKPVVLYDILSPDGFTIRMPGDKLFKTKSEGEKYFKQWKKRYERQGYYSLNYGRIPLSSLHEDCSWREVPSDKADSWLGFSGQTF